MTPLPVTAAELKQLAEEAAEVDRINLLPRARRRAALRLCRSYRRRRAATRAQRRAFGGWPGAFRPGYGA